MRKRAGLLLMATLILVVAACGPQMATPTPRGEESSPTPVAQEATSAPTAPTVPTQVPVEPKDLPVDPDDWRALGSADAPVTVIEYSDFQ